MANVKLSELPVASTAMGSGDTVIGINNGIDSNFTQNQILSTAIDSGVNLPLQAGSNANGDTGGQIVLAAGGDGSISFTSGSGNGDNPGNLNGGNVTINLGIPSGTGTRGRLKIVGLPTSASGLTSGMVWKNGSVLTIV